MSSNEDKLKKAFQQMGKNDVKLKQAFIRLREKVIYPYGIQFNDDGTNHPVPRPNKYEPTDVISDDDWEKIKKSYSTRFAPLDVPIELIGRYLDNYWDNWQDGYYPNAEKFLDTMDKVFSDFADIIPSKGNKSFTNILWFDELFQKFQNKIDEITWDGSKDWERTWDGKIYNDILIEQAKGIEKEIDLCFKKRIKHGLDLTDEMKSFKGYEEIWFEKNKSKIGHAPTPEQIKNAQTPEPEKVWHEPIGEVDSETYSNHTLYIVAEDMDDEWEKRKSTKEFRCYSGDRIKFFEWCSHKYLYKGGKTFTAEGMENSLIASRSRAKSKKDKDYQ